MQMKRYAHGLSARRHAFTLVELLVVMTIIGLLTGLIVAATIKFKDGAKAAVADAQVAKYQRALEAEYNLVLQKCHKDLPPDAVITHCNGNVEQARALHTAATLKINFPESFSEATTSFSIPASGGYTYIAKNTFSSVSGATPPPATSRNPSVVSTDYERAVLLYLIVKEKATAGTGTDTDAGSEQYTELFGTKNLTYFTDSYSYPLIFYRWARGGPNGELNKPPYVPQSALSNDPLDPRKLVTGLSGLPAGLGFDATNRVPTVVSFGKNQTFDSFGDDDRVGYRLSRFGSKGDGK